MRRYFVIVLIMSIANVLSGFGATPSKPDFAYPQTVSNNALKNLNTAIKKSDGPAIVRATLNYGLAQTEINPESIDEFKAKIQEIKQKVTQPLTLAMLDFVAADATNSDSLALATLNTYTDILRNASVNDWLTTIDADPQFTPTLYDFAIQAFSCLINNDSIRSEAIKFNVNNPYPRFILETVGVDNYESALGLYNKFKGLAVEAYALSELANRAHTLEQRSEAYKLCCESKSSLDNVLASAKSYLTRPDVKISCRNVVKLNDKLKINIKATCINDVILSITTNDSIAKPVREFNLHFPGEGVFAGDTIIEALLPDYGEYLIKMAYEGYTPNEWDKLKFTVTDFLLTQQQSKDKNAVFALDAVSGKQQSDVEIFCDKYITGRRGKDIYSPRLYNNKQHYNDYESIKSMNCYTDRAIYRHGDTVRYASTLFKISENDRQLDANSRVIVNLYNANHELIDNDIHTSDSFGRISGEFTIPNEGLNGHYFIEVTGYGSHYFLVSEYKAPTFEVEMTANRISPSVVELKGKAIGYNGFPIINGQVTIEIAKLPEWVWFRNYRNSQKTIIASDTISTQSDGTFATRIPVPQGANLVASCIATSPTGETHDASCFLPEYPFFINADIPTYVIAGNAPHISVIDNNGEPTNRHFRVELKSLTQDNMIEPDCNWSNIPSGAYTARITADDAKDYTSATFYVYRTTDAMPPTETALFLPKRTIYSGEKLLLGTSYDDSHILFTLWTPDSIVEQRWLTPDKGNFFLDINLPECMNEATVTLLTLRNYEFTTAQIDVTRKNIPSSLNISIESFRNNITPGDAETWTIKVSDNLGNPVEAAMILNLYSKALDALQPYSLNFNPPNPYFYYRNLHFNYPWISIDALQSYQRHTEPITLEFLDASFELYGQEWPHPYYMSYNHYGVMPRMLASKSMANDMVEAQGIVTESTTEETADGGISENNQSDNDVRMPEIPVAYWAPILSTDADGQTQIQFTAPNATTTWALKALAYNSALLSGLYSNEIISSKPIMVQPNLPGFLRMGDKIQLRASVINNTDSASEISATYEIFEPTTQEIFSKKEFQISLDAMASEVIAIDCTAPSTGLLGVRVKASSGSFTDGEQTILPILPNEISVITARSIYLDADSTQIEIDVPKGGAVTFTANAVWQCVAALPGLQQSESKSAFAAVNSLFSAATARGLMRKHPEIAMALHDWKDNDSILISRLSKNEDLKIALLNSTPFVNAARSETEQRAGLYLLFDKSQTERTISEAAYNLAKLVKNGGLAWTGSSTEPSFWVTLKVISTLAKLKRLGYLPDNDRLNRLIENAVKYLDTEVARQYNKDKNALFTEYVLMRSQFSNIRQSSPAKRAASATVQYLVGNWRDESLVGIAKAAIILYENGYQTTARTLIESLRQHEVWKYTEISPYYLEAFYKVTPSAPEVDMLRSAYISRLQSMDWGNHADASDLIATILDCGTPWLVPAANELSVKVNGEDYDCNTDNFMGEFRLNLPDGGKLEIHKGEYPAWGGVFSQSGDSIQGIDAFETDKLKITREIEGEMKVGAAITLKLTINAAQDLDYVIVRQPRCAAFEPKDQLPSTLWLGYLRAYREPCTSETNWYFNRLPKGEITITETFYITANGTFALAPAEIQSQYSPEFKAHSAGSEISISE